MLSGARHIAPFLLCVSSTKTDCQNIQRRYKHWLLNFSKNLIPEL